MEAGNGLQVPIATSQTNNIGFQQDIGFIYQCNYFSLLSVFHQITQKSFGTRMSYEKPIEPQWVKKPREKQPLWKEWDYNANKKGVRHTVYSVNGDEYTGEWLNNLKHGKGTYTWKHNKAIYDGDWAKGKRNGFGTYSLPQGNGYRKVYAGGWKNDKRHGYGTNFYTDDEYYEGEWYGDNRSGWGRMYYADGEYF